MTAGQARLVCERGATFHKLMTWKGSTGTPVDLTGCTATFTVAISKGNLGPPLLQLTNTHGITLGGALGTIALDLSATETEALGQGGVYELDIHFGGGRVVRLLEGPFELSLDVVRP